MSNRLTKIQRTVLRGLLVSVIASLGPRDTHSKMLKSILAAIGMMVFGFNVEGL